MVVADTDHAFGLHEDDLDLDTDPPESPLVRRVVPLPRRLAANGTADDSAQKLRRSSFELFGSAYTSSMAQHPYYLPLFSASGPNGHILSSSGQFIQDGSSDDDVSVSAVADIDARHVLDSDAIESLPPCRSPFAFGTDGGIYMDQFTHPGNTKKRKVPVTAHGRASGVDGSSDVMPSEELADRSFLTDRILTANAQYYPLNVLVRAKKSRMSRATKANLQMKEMLKSRRRQLAPVLGLLLQNDSLALEHSLSTLTSLYKRARDVEGHDLGCVVTRMSQREKKRRARSQGAKMKSYLDHHPENAGNDGANFPSSLFTFEHDSPTSRRHKATNEEVSILQKRFNSEIVRQTTKAAEHTKESAMMVNSMQTTEDPGDRGQGVAGAPQSQSQQPRAQLQGQQHRTGTGSGAQTPVSGEKIASKSKAKKKKRSAMANASNPHHLRNYVPSRLPNAGNNHTQSVQDSLGPFPIRFLSAGIMSKYRDGDTPRVNLTNPEEEWICPFCEYNLFYGSEQAYRKAIRQRKKILMRRRRAAERAATAAAGKRKGVVPPPSLDGEAGEDEFEDEIDQYEYGLNGFDADATGKKGSAGQDRDRDKYTAALDGGGGGTAPPIP